MARNALKDGAGSNRSKTARAIFSCCTPGSGLWLLGLNPKSTIHLLMVTVNRIWH